MAQCKLKREADPLPFTHVQLKLTITSIKNVFTITEKKQVLIWKKNFIQQGTLFPNKIQIHFPYNLLLSKHQVHHMYFYIDGY